MVLFISADFFQNSIFQKVLSGTLSVCQTVLIQIRTNILSVLIWIKSDCKVYQQRTKVAPSKERVNTWVKVQNFQNPELKKTKSKKMQYAYKISNLSSLNGQMCSEN